ncbi:hypothetical protein PPERSA_09916 [Pseudocohnilembus persalinus]|uniref:Uncharacterized protein n=1 Tax=Pseudocohnilembus persalinus TaxID=266149 RepID=A0A0V0QJF0_PSEPJ|nr:hypothetical protein PPERSA_09916 [Pseudocohnilembus persalinus]|eukprot:KRX02299.1 hypothetical protein PPERSA_09916 [Pseudocohnilembus persalinus]
MDQEEEILDQFQFKCGLMNFDEKSNLVSADKRKGMITISKLANSENATKINWNEEGQNEPEIEYYIFPGKGKCQISKQRQRVFILFNEEEPGFLDPIQFFWFQEKNQTLDEENVQRINNLIDLIDEEEDYEDIDEEDKSDEHQNLINNNYNNSDRNTHNNNIIQNLLNQNRDNNASTSQNQIEQALSQIQFLGQNNAQGQNLFQQMLQAQQQKTAPYLQYLLTPEYLQDIAKDQDFQNALIEYLPQGQQSVHQLLPNMQSPQFKQGIESLDRALSEGQGVQGLLYSFGLNGEIMNNVVDGNEALYQALQKYANDKKNQKD